MYKQHFPINQKHNGIRFFTLLITCLFLSCGCGINQPQQKPSGGPQGSLKSQSHNPPLNMRFASPPPELYDLDIKAGILFQSLNTQQWDTAHNDFQELQTAWEQIKPSLGDQETVKKGDQMLLDLVTSLDQKKSTSSFDALQGFVATLADLAKAFKLSPLSDILAVDNAVRNVSFYLEDKNWKQASVKAKELDSTFGQSRISFEKIGILSQITRTHNHVKQLLDAVNAENKGSVDNHLQEINEGMALIGQYYRGK